MLRDIVPFADGWRILRKNSPTRDAIEGFVKFVEKKVGGAMVYDGERFPYDRPHLADLFELAEALRAARVITSYRPRYLPPDEPPMRMWIAKYRDGDESVAGGVAVDDDRSALTAALAESVERKIWAEKTDYFRDERRASVADIQRIGDALTPKSFSGISETTRRAHSHLTLRDDASYLWIRGTRWPEGTSVYVPAQVVSAAPQAHAFHREGEPTIVYPITTGLATWPTRDGAILRGILEGMERDAYMITWLNKLSPTLFDIDALALERPSLAILVARCRRYRLEPRIVRLVTDAPTYVVCASLEDLTGNAPRFAHGLKAGADPARAAESAILEALRARRPTLVQLQKKKPEDPPLETKNVGHFDRLLYWAEGNRFERLRFLHAGPVTTHDEPWRNESDSAHLARLLQWLKEKEYGCASISLTHSKANLTPWHIEFTIIPELQPTHLNEKRAYTGGKRLTEVPRMLGFVPRAEAYLDDPHPFA